MAQVQFIDLLLREYLVFRGFSTTLKNFDQEAQSSNLNYRSNKICEKIQQYIFNYDLGSLRELWLHLDVHLFNKLEHHYTEAVKKLEAGILKYYLCVAHLNGKSEKIQEFFIKMAPELHNQSSEWREWFYFPFAKNAEENPNFSVYFTKSWQETLMLSIHNFLATCFQCMPSPTIMKLEVETSLIRKLQDENTKLRQRIQAFCTSGQAPTLSSSHQSRISSFYDKKQGQDHKLLSGITNPNDILPLYVSPPSHLVDDFYIISQETSHVGALSENQVRGFKSLIRNISSVSPGRKDGSTDKNRSGSVGSRNARLSKD